MSKGICMDCGMILPADTKICTVCGFDNEDAQQQETSFRDNSAEYYEEVAPENYPGF